MTVAAIVATAIVSVTFAQDAAQTQPGAAAADAAATADVLQGKETNQGVYVRDSASAVKALDDAQNMQRQGAWDRAADILQEVIEKYPDRVVPSQVDQNNIIYQYTSVVSAVQERLAKWPAEGLAVYQGRYGPAAAAMIEAAPDGDLAALHKVVSLYFVTDAGRDAAIQLIDRYLESGEFPAAAWLAHRLLAWHPGLGDGRPMLLYRAALAAHLSGNAAQAQERLKELAEHHAGATGTVRGEEVVLAESLATELKQPAAPVSRATVGDDWPVFCGSPDRARVPAVAGRSGARIYDIEYARPPRRPQQVQNRAVSELMQAAQEQKRVRDLGFTLGVMPVVDRGELFFQDNARVYAVSLASGVPLPGWSASYGDRDGQYVAPGNLTPMPQHRQMTLSVSPDSVLAVLGQVDRAAMMNGIIASGDREARLVCLDRATGKERWTVTPSRLTDPALRQLRLGGSPLVVGDNVYILAGGGQPMQFEDSYVLCFGLRDGTLRWSCYLASGNADPAMFNGGGGTVDAGVDVPHLAYASGRLYALTNVGALAAVDAYAGTIVWLNIYPRPKPQFQDFRMRWNRDRAELPRPPWAHNPPVVTEGKVFVLPDDADHVVVYDAGTGVELKRIRTSDGFENADTLVGVLENQLVLCSDRTAFNIDWTKYDAERRPEDNLIWKTTLIRGGGLAGETPVRGRGFLTRDSVFVPTLWNLRRISLRTGKVEESYPKNREDWDAAEGPGNVLVTQDHVIVAGAERVTAYTDLAVARAKLDAEVAAAPSDPEPRLRYAELMFAAAQHELAAARLDEAIELLGGVKSMRPGPYRDRAFSIALTFAQKQAAAAADGTADANSPEQAMADRLFDRAGAAASAPAQQVNYRVSRARFDEALAEHEDAVRLYQELIADPTLREVRITDETGTPTEAGAVAEKMIARLIERAGPDVYAPFEQAAAEALEQARQTGDPARLLAVAQSYPNAQAARGAMAAAADAYESAGNPRQATQVLNQIYRRYRDVTGADALALIESQARNYLALPNGVGVAVGRLAEADRIDGDERLTRPLRLPDGTLLEGVTYKQALEAVRKYHASASAARLADFRIPRPPALPAPGNRAPAEPFQPLRADDVLADVDQLLVPARDHVRHDRVTTDAAGRGVAVYEVGQRQPLGTYNLAEPPRGSAWVNDNLLVWSSGRVALLRGTDASRVWDVAIKSLPAVEVVQIAPDVDVQQPPPGGDAGMGEVLVQENRRIRIRGGRWMVQQRGGAPFGGAGRIVPPPDGAERVDHVRPVGGDRVIIGTSTGRVAALDLSTGTLAWQTRLGEMPVERLLASDDFVVAVVNGAAGTQLVVLDTFAGQVVTRRSFTQDNAGMLVNVALSPGGMLVFTLPDRLCGKDLYEPGADLSFQHAAGGDGTPLYLGAVGPDQLVIADARVLALTDNGQYVRVHSLETGHALGMPLPTGTDGWGGFLRVVGPRLYVINGKTVYGYNLDRPSEHWKGAEFPPPLNIADAFIVDAFIGKDYVVLLGAETNRPAANVLELGVGPGRPGGPADAPGPAVAYRLLAYGRYPSRGGATNESGRLDYQPRIRHLPGIDTWLPVDGGFYYRTTDRKAHFLRGADQTGRSDED